MDIQEARRILREHLEKYRTLPYNQLKKRVNKQETEEIVTPLGVKYQVEIEVLWVNKSEGNLCVRGTIDDGGWRTFYPLTEELIRTPNGYFTNGNGQPVAGNQSKFANRSAHQEG